MILELRQADLLRRGRRPPAWRLFQALPRQFTIVLLAKAPKLQGVVLARRTDVIGHQIIVRNHVSLLGMIPQPADIFNELPVMVNQHMVNRDHPVGRIARVGEALQPRQTPQVPRLWIPARFGDPAVQARLVGRHRRLGVDPVHRLAFGRQQARQVFRQMAAGWFVAEQVAKVFQRLFHYGRKLDNARHRAPPSADAIPHLNLFSSLQKSRSNIRLSAGLKRIKVVYPTRAAVYPCDRA